MAVKENRVRRILHNETLTRDIIRAGDELVTTDKLTDDDRHHCQQLAIEGFYYFDKLGWTTEKESNFLARPSVRRELDRLSGQMQNSEGLEQRSKFFARLRMLQMLPGALAIVQKTLVGPQPGQSLASVPTMEQYQAARDIVEWCGIRANSGGSIGTMNVQIINQPEIDRHTESADEIKDKYDPMKVLQRTRVREVLDKIVDINIKTDSELSQWDALRKDTIKRKKLKKLKKERGEA